MGDPHRRAAHAWTRLYWRKHFPDAELVEAAPDPFTRAAGLNAAIRIATRDLILQADPDTIVPVEHALVALHMANARDGLVVPYDHYLYLTEEATRRLHGGADEYSFTDADCEFSGIKGAGPVTAFSRRTWEMAHGYDERFGLWGGDDMAFAFACEAYTGVEVRRVPGPVLHSWHPRLPESVPGQPGYAEGFVLAAEYRDAASEGPDAIKFMVEGGRRNLDNVGYTWNG
jgi:glycosyl transferase family 7 (putative galactosyltransferase)